MVFVPPFLVPPAATVPHHVLDTGGAEVNLAAKGILPGGKVGWDVAITSGSTSFTVSGLGWGMLLTQADIGKSVTLLGAGAGGGGLDTTLATVGLDGLSGTVAAAAATTVAAIAHKIMHVRGADVGPRTNSLLALLAAVDATLGVRSRVVAQDGIYDTSVKIAWPAHLDYAGPATTGSQDTTRLFLHWGAVWRPSVNALDAVFEIASTDSSGGEGTQAMGVCLDQLQIDCDTSKRPLAGIKCKNFGHVRLQRCRVAHVNGGAWTLTRDAPSSTYVGYMAAASGCSFGDSVHGIRVADDTSQGVFLDLWNTELRNCSGAAIKAIAHGLHLSQVGGFMGGNIGGHYDIQGGGAANEWGGLHAAGINFENGCAMASATNAAITSGTAALAGTFTNAGSGALAHGLSASDVGNLVRVAGAGAAGADLYGHIVTVTDATHCTLDASAGATVAGVEANLNPTAMFFRDFRNLDIHGEIAFTDTVNYAARSFINADHGNNLGVALTISANALVTTATSAGAAAIVLGPTVSDFHGSVNTYGTWTGKAKLTDAGPALGRHYALDGVRTENSGMLTLAPSDFALSAGWGTTASVQGTTTGGTDLAGFCQVGSAGTGQLASPTVTLTYKHARQVLPMLITSRTTNAGAGSQPTIPFVYDPVNSTKTQAVFTFLGTPVAGQNYYFGWLGRER